MRIEGYVGTNPSVFSLLEAMQKLDTAEAELSRLRGDLQVRRLRSHAGDKTSSTRMGGDEAVMNCSKTCEIFVR